MYSMICRLYSSPAVTVPYIDNEPMLQFAPGSDERAAVEKVGSCICYRGGEYIIYDQAHLTPLTYLTPLITNLILTPVIFHLNSFSRLSKVFVIMWRRSLV
jgi:hypothetical protein